MGKHFKYVLAILICFFMATTLLSASAFKNTGINSSVQARAKPLMHEQSVQVLTLDDSITVTATFNEPITLKKDGRHLVEILDLPTYGAPGEPILPQKTLTILIPQGKEPESINILNRQQKTLVGKFNLDYGKTPTPIGSAPSKTDRPNPSIYSSSNPYPKALYSEISIQYFRGYKILSVTLNPVQYTPKTGRVSYSETITLTITLRQTGENLLLLRRSQEDRNILKSTVDNPDAIESYTLENLMVNNIEATTLVNPSESYQYVIITNNELNSSFQPLVDWKNLKGVNTTTVLREDILNDPNYFSNGIFGDGNGTSAFNGTAARIRNFIKDAYQNWETEYVLLGGDVEIIPTRGVYAYVTTDPLTLDHSIPCDLYFGGLDGSWNNDNDTVWGEGIFDEGPENATAGEEADFFAEVYVGRAPVNTPTEVSNFVNKTLWYEANTDDSYLRKAVMMGEILDEETRAGNSKDMASDIIPQYTTRRLYQRDGTFNQASVLDAINSGTHIVNHDGHTNTNIMMELDPVEIDTLIVNDEFFFGYSVGCYAAAFDATDSVVEHFLYNPHGAFAFISNSRYGWYFPGSSAGPGEQFDRAFFQVTKTTQNLGKTLQLSKESKFSASVHRWTYFNLNLLGDPETSIVTEIEAPTAHFETNPTASRLSAPVFKGFLNLTGIAKNGTAQGSTFSNFTVDFGRGTNPISWLTTGITLANSGQTEVDDDLLATWDISGISPGIVTVRLTVQDLNGTIGEDRWIIRIENLPAIRIEPSLVETQEGLPFTISARLTDPEDLYGLNFKMNWNTTLVDYISHDVYIPRNVYLWGVLYEPVDIEKDEVNQTAGEYWIEAISSDDSPFERDGTVFNMTFQAKVSGTFNLTIHSSNLTGNFGQSLIHNVFNSTVEISAGVHDGAVANITTSGVLVGEGYSTSINVTIANEGTFTETFNCTLYANSTAIDTAQVLIAGLNEATFTIVWDTTSWTLGNYTISANLTLVDGETDASDNSMADGKILVTTPGDVDGDFDVDIFDIVKIATSYGSVEGEPLYNGDADVDGDGDVDIFDIVVAAGNYGTSP